MSDAELPNAWEVTGWRWECEYCPASVDGIHDDYSLAYGQASTHATANPSHRVVLEQVRRRWVIPQTKPNDQ